MAGSGRSIGSICVVEHMSSRSRRMALCNLFRRHHMKWETPTATDLRFGFEITMYVSAR